MTIKVKGVTYDTGMTMIGGGLTRPTLSAELIEAEIRVIAEELHCNAVRITGQDIARLELAAGVASRHGLDVWISPTLHEADEQETCARVSEAATVAETIRKSGKTRVVLVLGCELSVFMTGLIPGDSGPERLGVLADPSRWSPELFAHGSPVERLDGFLGRTAAEARRRFDGPLTYASGLWEEINWDVFDIVGIDAYRDAGNADRFRELVAGYHDHGKPVAVTEFGCCTYAGAEALGSAGWMAVDRTTTPWSLSRPLTRNEDVQARYLMDLLALFEAEGVAGAFVFTFVTPGYPSNTDPRYDLDAASFSLVRTWSADLARPRLLPAWEPKKSFHAVASYYRGDQVDR